MVMPKNIVILNGAGPDDTDVRILGALCQSLDGEAQVFHLCEARLAHCIGCFGCWIKTPGVCVEPDSGREIARAIVRSDLTVLFTPVTFGGYSPTLKRMVDRFVQIASPFFAFDHGEVHHPPRYFKRPRLLMVGVQRRENQHEAQIFRTLAGRNAINFHPPSFAVEVVQSGEDASTLAAQFRSLAERNDPLPFGSAIQSLMPEAVAVDALPAMENEHNALIIVGSPKVNETSVSSVLSEFLQQRLLLHGWQAELLTLRASLNRAEGEAELIAAAQRSALILLVFPLYVDSLPYLVTRALTVLASIGRAGQRVSVVVNSGFPEVHQSAVALSICREFAVQSSRTWAGGVAFVAGGMIGTEPLTNAKRSGPPLPHAVKALELIADALASGLPIPAEAMQLAAKTLLPPVFFNRLYMWMGGRSFLKAAARNGISKRLLLAQPYS